MKERDSIFISGIQMKREGEKVVLLVELPGRGYLRVREMKADSLMEQVDVESIVRSPMERT